MKIAKYPHRQELSALTGLRYAAAIWVVLFHVAPIQGESVARPIRDFIGVGYLAVSLFFVLSGFVLSYSYLDGVGSMRGDRRSFWISRVARIYPAYLLSFVLCLPLYVAAKAPTGTPISVTLRVCGVSALYLTLMQAWTPWTAFILNFPAWSLSDEAFFYFCFPSARKVVRVGGRTLAMAICACFVLAVVPGALIFWAGASKETFKSPQQNLWVDSGSGRWPKLW